METQKTLIVIDSERDKQKKAQQEQTKVKEAKKSIQLIASLLYMARNCEPIYFFFFITTPLSPSRSLQSLPPFCSFFLYLRDHATSA